MNTISYPLFVHETQQNLGSGAIFHEAVRKNGI